MYTYGKTPRKKIESYIVRYGDGEIADLKPGYDTIPCDDFACYIEWGMYENEEYVFERLHRSGTKDEKAWIEELFTEMNYHRESSLLSRGEYGEFESYVNEKWEPKID